MSVIQKINNHYSTFPKEIKSLLIAFEKPSCDQASLDDAHFWAKTIALDQLSSAFAAITSRFEKKMKAAMAALSSASELYELVLSRGYAIEQRFADKAALDNARVARTKLKQKIEQEQQALRDALAENKRLRDSQAAKTLSMMRKGNLLHSRKRAKLSLGIPDSQYSTAESVSTSNDTSSDTSGGEPAPSLEKSPTPAELGIPDINAATDATAAALAQRFRSRGRSASTGDNIDAGSSSTSPSPKTTGKGSELSSGSWSAFFNEHPAPAADGMDVDDDE
jgi:hypothetical protein